MTGEPEDNDFESLIEHMSDEHAPQQVEIVEIAEQAVVVEVLVPIANFAHPEVILFRTFAKYLETPPRRALIGVSVTYEIRSHNQPFLIGSFIMSPPVE